MGPKYKFTDETINFDGHVLHRIKRISDSKLGGWIEKEENLSQEGSCWVDDNAKVYNYAKVFDNAQVYDYALVYSIAKVSGNAQVYDDAQIHGSAQIYDNAKIFNNAKVFGNSKVYGDAEISNQVEIFDGAKVYGNAQIFSNAHIYGDAIVEGTTSVHGNIEISSGIYTSGAHYTYKPTKDQFKDYLVVQHAGITNMYDFNTILEYSKHSLTKDKILYIIEHYDDLVTEFKISIDDITDEDLKNYEI